MAENDRAQPGADLVPQRAAGLTAQQEEFAAGIAMGKTQAAAFREAFPHAATWKDHSVYVEASNLAARPEVRARVADLRALAAELSGASIEAHLQRLAELGRAAQAAGHWSAAIRAEELRGKACGFYAARVELSGSVTGMVPMSPLTPDEFRAIARELLDEV